MEITWTSTGDGEFPYRAEFQGAHLTIRVNDFPAEPLYTLFADGKPAFDLEDWPSGWIRPAATADRLRVGGEAQRRRGRIDAIVVADLAHRFCAAPPGPPEAVRAALGDLAPERAEFVEERGVVTAVVLHLTGDGLEELLGTQVAVDGAPFVGEVVTSGVHVRLSRRPAPGSTAAAG